MKNKKLIYVGLLSLIIVLVGIASCYYSFKIDDYIEKTKESDNSTSSKDNSSDDDNSNTYYPNELEVVSSYDRFSELSSSDKNVFIVIGRDGCHYCDLYLPVLKDLTHKYGIEIAYVDMAALSSEDYYKVLDTPLAVPGKCTKTGQDLYLRDGFGTPLSLFVNSNKTYDCIRGYKDKDSLVKILKSIGYIK